MQEEEEEQQQQFSNFKDRRGNLAVKNTVLETQKSLGIQGIYKSLEIHRLDKSKR